MNQPEPASQPEAGQIYIAEFLKYSEFCCKHCGRGPIDPALVAAWQDFRVNRYCTPINIVSGYRCPIHNKNEGGSRTSKHMLGQAMDWAPVEVVGWDYFFTDDFIAQAWFSGFRGIGRGHSLNSGNPQLHVDVNGRGMAPDEIALWDYPFTPESFRVVKIKTFGISNEREGSKDEKA